MIPWKETWDFFLKEIFTLKRKPLLEISITERSAELQLEIRKWPWSVRPSLWLTASLPDWPLLESAKGKKIRQANLLTFLLPDGHLCGPRDALHSYLLFLISYLYENLPTSRSDASAGWAWDPLSEAIREPATIQLWCVPEQWHFLSKEQWLPLSFLGETMGLLQGSAVLTQRQGAESTATCSGT